MQNNLVIVESPAKSKTIGRFLGKDYKVMSSFGHIRDLKSKSFSIDTKTFEDREGEAISWHLAEVLGLNVANTKRIVFHEITPTAIAEAIKHPRTIDLNLVNAVNFIDQTKQEGQNVEERIVPQLSDDEIRERHSRLTIKTLLYGIGILMGALLIYVIYNIYMLLG